MIRPPTVAGQFYPADKKELTATIGGFLAKARDVEITGELRGLIVPHAGCVFSGPVAATGYKLLKKQNLKNPVIFLLGSPHQVWCEGMVLPGYQAFSTPLGRIAVDREAMQILKATDKVRVSNLPHGPEHSLEVQLPFLQITISGAFTIVPILIGDGDYREFAEILHRAAERLVGREVIWIVSTDLSHYEDYETAQAMDDRTCRAIVNLAPKEILPEGACGRPAVQTTLILAEKLNWQIKLLDCRNSGDISGDRSQVVGYGAFAVYDPKIII